EVISDFGPAPFRFYHSWLALPGFGDLVTKSWNSFILDDSNGVSEDELCGQFLSALQKVQYFGTAANGDDEQALQRAKNLFHSAFAV
nr:hypothetical protein [Tanacetum cinerariifolium]